MEKIYSQKLGKEGITHDGMIHQEKFLVGGEIDRGNSLRWKKVKLGKGETLHVKLSLF